jgi:hypothetical protein
VLGAVPADSIIEDRSNVRARRITADTAQILVGVTITSMVLLAVVAAGGSGAKAWMTVIIGALVVWMSLALLATIGARDEFEERLDVERTTGLELSRHVDAVAAAIRSEVDELRAMTARVSVLADETSAMSAGLDRTDHLVDDLAAIVAASAGSTPQIEVIDVWRAVRRATAGIELTAAGDGTPFALTSRRSFEAAVRLIASTLPRVGATTVTVQTIDGVVKATLASEDGGLEVSEIESVFGPSPESPFLVEGPLQRIALARLVARHCGGDVAYVRALGRSNYVVVMPAIATDAIDETPPILTLTLPLEPGEDTETSTSSEDSVSID